MTDFRPPRYIYVDDRKQERHTRPFKISERTANNIKYIIVFGVLLTTFYAFANLNSFDYMGFFSSQSFLYVAVSYVMLFLLWQGINNRLSKFPIEIIKSASLKKTRQTKLQKNSDKKVALFPMFGYTLSLAFSLMIMIFLFVAHLSGTGETRVIWNYYGEMMIETVLFAGAFIVVIIGFYYTFKRFKYEMRQF